MNDHLHPSSVGFGVLGGASFVANRAVLPAIDHADGAHLAAIASRSGAVDPRWSDRQVPDYDDVLAHPGVDAVYIPLPNGMHEEWATKAADAGKAVLCEKPLAPDAVVAERIVNACAEGGVLLAEAWMTPFDARWRRVLHDIEAGAVGTPDRIDARFTFSIGPESATNYRWDRAQGGGALLDVGIYTLGLPITLWGTDVDRIVVHERVVDDRGVDATTRAELTWAGGQVATLHCSFVDDEVQRLSIAGDGGTITVMGDAFTGGADATEHHLTDAASRTVTGPANDPYRAMVESFVEAVSGTATWPRPASHAADLLRLLDRIARQEVSP